MNWQPSASLAVLKQRAEVTAELRRFFALRDVMEVETPILSAAGTVDRHIESMTTQTASAGYRQGQAWLHTSPEFAMKRLLCAGSGAIYQLCKVFRAEELGSRHNPEFSLLEWYRPDFSMEQLMSELDELVRDLATDRLVLNESLFISYEQAFLQYAQLQPYTATLGEAETCLARHQIELPAKCSVAEALDLIMALVVEPQLPKSSPVFIHHYPASQASLAEIDPQQPHTALRFELFLGGYELANGFQELRVADEQAQRFVADQALRDEAGLSFVPYDQNLIAALQAGLPTCSGVAVGFDRLLMVLLAKDEISQVMSFSAEIS